MGKWFFISSMLHALLLISGGPVYASGHAGHHHADVISPFEKTGMPVYCALLGHSLNNPCPHILKSLGRDDGNVPSIAADCGGTPVYPGSTGWDKNLPSADMHLVADFPLSSTPIVASETHFSPLILFAIEHPPRCV